MIKKLLLAVALALPMLASAQTLKIGICDVNAVAQALPETAEAQTKLQESQKKLEDEYGRLQDEMRRLYEDLQKMAEDELPAIKERKTREFQDYQSKVANFEQSAMQNLQDLQMQLMAPITTKVRNAVESVGKENNFSLIQDKVDALTLYYAAPVEDVTPLVKAKLGIK